MLVSKTSSKEHAITGSVYVMNAAIRGFGGKWRLSRSRRTPRDASGKDSWSSPDIQGWCLLNLALSLRSWRVDDLV